MPRETHDGSERSAAPRPLDRVVLEVSVVLLVLFAASTALLWRLGIFNADTRASNAQILAAAIGLVGVLVTASFTFVGVLLKYSIDARTAQQAAEEAKRQQLETSIRAVQLLTEGGQPATPTRQAGALFVLVNQKQFEFASALLGQIWADREISPGAAAWVVDRLLLEGDAALQVEAAVLFDANAETLARPRSGYEWPDCVDLAWSNDIAPAARECLLSALMRILLSKDFEEWEQPDLNEAVLQLQLIGQTDERSYIRNTAYVCLAVLIDAILGADRLVAESGLFGPDGVVYISDVHSEASQYAEAAGSDVLESVDLFASRMRTEWCP